MSFFVRVKNKTLYEIYKVGRRWDILINVKLANRIFGTPDVKSIDETLDKLLSGRISMSRFGDGEYKVMTGGWNGFQNASPKLSKRLKEIVKLNGKYDDFLVCIPNAPKGLELLCDEAHRFWESFIIECGFSWYRLLNLNNEYYNAHVTRLYYDWKSKEKCASWYKKIMRLWQGRDVLIIEGEKSRLGVGNDLFDSAKSIKRILAPSNNAFGKYQEILDVVNGLSKDCLVLIALGQTATVLAYDLYTLGYQALDIGHIDIEYEWFLKKATEKIAVKGKYVKEVQTLDEVNDVLDESYEKQIIAKIL